jgi:hydroxymethylpyrimidine pyrophosphatase-like HAD family hydrolase
MIQGCGRGIEVENAINEVRDIATEICKSNEEDGVANWIETNLLF